MPSWALCKRNTGKKHSALVDSLPTISQNNHSYLMTTNLIIKLNQVTAPRQTLPILPVCVFSSAMPNSPVLSSRVILVNPVDPISLWPSTCFVSPWWIMEGESSAVDCDDEQHEEEEADGCVDALCSFVVDEEVASCLLSSALLSLSCCCWLEGSGIIFEEPTIS